MKKVDLETFKKRISINSSAKNLALVSVEFDGLRTHLPPMTIEPIFKKVMKVWEMAFASTRNEALANGDMYYFTGIECKHGHVSPRMASSKGCYVCLRARDDSTNEGHRARREADPVGERIKRMNREFKRSYGITYDDFREIIKKQNNKCAICGVDETAVDVSKKRGQLTNFACDHDHVTGEVRGALCDKCNTSIGLMDDDRERFKKAIEYLDTHTIASIKKMTKKLKEKK